MVRCRDAIAEIWGEFLAHFHAVTIKCHSSMRNWPFVLPGIIIYEHTLDFSPVSPFSGCPERSILFKHPCAPHAFFLESLSNHCQGHRLTSSDICTKLMFLCRVRCKIASCRKSQHLHPATWRFVHWIPRYTSTIIYRCIALLQLLYRRQHQSLKLWIPPCIIPLCYKSEGCRLLDFFQRYLILTDALKRWHLLSL
jgi:hypothetical protein